MSGEMALPFWQIITAVMFANMLTVGWIYGFFLIRKNNEESLVGYGLVIFPMLLTAGGFYISVY